jgi:hypothetical protein
MVSFLSVLTKAAAISLTWGGCSGPNYLAKKWTEWMKTEGTKKETRGGLFFVAGLTGLLLQVKQDALEVSFVEDLLVFGGAEEESGTADVVDEPGNTFGLVVQGGDESIREKLTGVASGDKLMFDVSSSFGQVERGESIADGDALVKGLIGGEAEFGG